MRNEAKDITGEKKDYRKIKINEKRGEDIKEGDVRSNVK